jgi:hypothetical protein
VAANEDEILGLVSVFHRNIREANAYCKHTCCGRASESSLMALGKLSRFGIERIDNIELGNISFVFKSAIASAIGEIPNRPDPGFLLHMNVKLVRYCSMTRRVSARSGKASHKLLSKYSPAYFLYG